MGVEQQWQLQQCTQMNEIRIEKRERVESATASDFALYCCYFGAFDLMLMIQSMLHVSPAVLYALDLFTEYSLQFSHILAIRHTKTDFLICIIAESALVPNTIARHMFKSIHKY